MLLSTLGASLLGDLLTKKLSDRGAVRAWEGTTKSGMDLQKVTSPPINQFWDTVALSKWT